MQKNPLKINVMRFISATILIFLLHCQLCFAQVTSSKPVEPNAGTWKTLVIASSNVISVPPPPSKEATLKEQAIIINRQKNIDSAIIKEIHYWNAGPPAYRWQIIADELHDTAQYWGRVYPYMNAAIFDATITAWNAKFKYNRIRPFEAIIAIKNLVPVSVNPSYPCEHSVTAGASATVLGYLFPSKKDSLIQLAKKAGESRIAAGLQYPSDVEAGFVLGVKVGEQVIEKAKSDGYDKAWAGTVPKGREFYTGRTMKKDLANMKPWILDSQSQFRSPPPPDIEKDMQEMKAFKPDYAAMARAFKWEFSWPWGDVVDQKIFEYNLTGNAPRAAFIYALTSISDYENQLAHWDGKYTYYRARPDQYDTTYKAVFKTPTSPPILQDMVLWVIQGLRFFLIYFHLIKNNFMP